MNKKLSQQTGVFIFFFLPYVNILEFKRKAKKVLVFLCRLKIVAFTFSRQAITHQRKLYSYVCVFQYVCQSDPNYSQSEKPNGTGQNMLLMTEFVKATGLQVMQIGNATGTQMKKNLQSMLQPHISRSPFCWQV